MRVRKCKDCGCDISGRYIKAQRCCDCAVKRQQRLAKRRRRAEFFAARDAAFEKAGQPLPKIEERGGVRVERRGTCVGGAAFNPTVPISPKSYYYR